ncbi:MAG: delta 1-pyrroline-5-carboxylate synthetase [Methylophaga sp.]|nr:delta 1-pyrroline-5-carboxylate synthetase [Methylophaga sp.]
MLTVIKLGGSFYHSSQLTDCLQTIIQFSENHPVVLVAGGGPFADLVRQAQLVHPFSDKTAHQMAINGMRQFALLLLDLLPDALIFEPLNMPLPNTGLAVWLPDDRQMMTADLPQNWQVSADSLALWLAQQLHADELILIKSGAFDTPQIKALADIGVLDAHFAKQYQQQPLPCSIVQRTDVAGWLSRRMLLT